MFHVPEKFRLTGKHLGPWDSNASYGNNGVFQLPIWPFPTQGFHQENLRCLASDGGGWEHVSVSAQERCPTWQEMCTVKDLFWDEEDTVMQLHPPKSEYVNHHPFCLHLWRPIGVEVPRPPSIMVGPKT